MEEICLNCDHPKIHHHANGKMCFFAIDHSGGYTTCGCVLYTPKYIHDMERNTSEDRLQSIIDERKKVYGDPFLSHQAIGLSWEGILRNRYHEYDFGPVGKLFPADLVADFLAGFKVVRLARPVFHQDSADDTHNYVNFDVDFRSCKCPEGKQSLSGPPNGPTIHCRVHGVKW